MDGKEKGWEVCERKTERWNDGSRGRRGETESMAAVQGQSSSTIAQTLSMHDLSSIQNEVRGQLNLSLSRSLSRCVCVTLCMTNPACRSDYLAHSQKESESMDESCSVM